MSVRKEALEKDDALALRQAAETEEFEGYGSQADFYRELADNIDAVLARMDDELWSFTRSALTQGQAQEQDYRAGKYASYEAYSARTDAAARERAAELRSILLRAVVAS